MGPQWQPLARRGPGRQARTSLRRWLWLLGATGAVLIWAVNAAFDSAPYLRVLDGLEVPGNWQAQRTIQQGFTDSGPDAIRYYVVDADPRDLVAPARSLLDAAGYQAAPGYGDTCSESGGPLTCYLHGTRGSVRLSVVIFERGAKDSIWQDGRWESSGAPGLALLRLTAGTEP